MKAIGQVFATVVLTCIAVLVVAVTVWVVRVAFG